MKKLITLTLFLMSLITGMSSCKKDQTLDLDITKFTWKLKEVRTSGNTFKAEEKEYFRETAFVLIFNTDSIFSLNTSVNFAGGKYEIATKGEIKIYSYRESTKVGTLDTKDLELNTNLLIVFKGVTEYEVIGETLIFKGDKGEVEFKKE